MRSKTPLVMMEQLVMVLVFALAAALCIQVFVFSDQTSRYHEARDHAVLEAQNAAEALKSGNETYFFTMSASSSEAFRFILAYDDTWQPLHDTTNDSSAAYTLTVADTESAQEGLWTAEITVRAADGQELFQLTVAGQTQEVARHA